METDIENCANLCQADQQWIEALVRDLQEYADNAGNGEIRERLADLGLPSLRHLRPEEKREYRSMSITEPGDRLTLTGPLGVSERTIGEGEHVIFEEPQGGGPSRFRLAREDHDKYGMFYHFYDGDLAGDDVVFRGDEDFSLAELRDAAHKRRYGRPGH